MPSLQEERLSYVKKWGRGGTLPRILAAAEAFDSPFWRTPALDQVRCRSWDSEVDS